MAFDKELAILGGFFNLRISKKNYPSRKKPQWGRKHFFLKKYIYCLILYQNAYNFICKTAKFYVLNQSRSTLLIPPKYTLEN